jgi:hypothetical protein
MPYCCTVYAIYGYETCSLAETYKRFRESFCLHLQEINRETGTPETSVCIYHLYDDVSSQKNISIMFTLIRHSNPVKILKADIILCFWQVCGKNSDVPSRGTT